MVYSHNISNTICCLIDLLKLNHVFEFTFLLLLILIYKDKMIHPIKKMFSPLTKCDFPCASCFPAKFVDILYTKFYGFYAYSTHLKCA